VTTDNSTDRIDELDGLRAFAVVMVLVWHYFGEPLFATPSAPAYLKYILMTGRTGVDLFFVLSGFLITRILIANRTADNYFRIFYFRRAMRILPLFYLVFLSMLIGRQTGWQLSFFESPFSDWYYVFYAQNYPMSWLHTFGAPWLAITWSLAVEDQFYLAFPLLIWLTPPRRLPYFLALLFVLPYFFRWVAHFELHNPLAAYILPFGRADSLTVGSVIAWALSTERAKAFIESKTKEINFVVFASLLVFPLIAIAYAYDLALNMVLWGYVYLEIFFGIAVLTAVINSQAPSLAFLRSRPLRFFAEITYALYLVHPITILVAFGIAERPISLNTFLYFQLVLLSLIASILICIFTLHVIERPCIRFGHRPKYRRERAGTLASA
jgi:peptidoglycan/LPS O-acetylase OafA/YrhL